MSNFKSAKSYGTQQVQQQPVVESVFHAPAEPQVNVTSTVTVTPQEPEVTPAREPERRPMRFRVVRAQMVSWCGAMTLLKAGDEIAAIDYGGGGIKRLVEQGVKLEPLY